MGEEPSYYPQLLLLLVHDRLAWLGPATSHLALYVPLNHGVWFGARRCCLSRCCDIIHHDVAAAKASPPVLGGPMRSWNLRWTAGGRTNTTLWLPGGPSSQSCASKRHSGFACLSLIPARCCIESSALYLPLSQPTTRALVQEAGWKYGGDRRRHLLERISDSFLDAQRPLEPKRWSLGPSA